MKTLYFDENKKALRAIDQRKLPNTLEYIDIADARSLFDAIKSLAVRGAPAIGVAAALGLYACALRFEDVTPGGFIYSFNKTADFITGSRPTAHDLFYAAARMKKVAAEHESSSVSGILEALRSEAFAIYDEDLAMCRAIGLHGASLIKDGGTVLTHCNAGALCAVDYGTALSPIYVAKEQGKKVSVYADETRPLLQGARLTAFELCEHGVDTTVICDNMASSLMQAGKIDLIIVGCDRVAANGDFANKIGTLSVAVNAAYFGVPFYVAAPSSTIDRTISDGSGIPVEFRDGREISEYWYSERMIPSGAGTWNPAFDVTPGKLVTGYITENGVIEKV